MKLNDIGLFFIKILDSILPRRKRTVRIEGYSLLNIPVEPSEHQVCGTRITTLMNYRTRGAEDLIRALKYDKSMHAAQLLAQILAEYLQEEIAQIKSFSTFPVILVPVPLHKDRERERGFNQIEIVLNELPKEFRDGSLSRVAPMLKRIRATAQQTKLPREERLKNVAGAFVVTNAELIHNSHVILIDDVTTTGATLTEAARPLKDANVTLLALAHA